MKNKNKPLGGWFRKYVLDYAWPISIVPSVLIATLGNENALRSARVEVGVAMVGVSSAFLGIVLAGLAIFVVFLDKKYVLLFEKLTGIEINVEPFKWTAIIGIVCALFGMGLIILGKPSETVFRISIGASLTVFIYLLLQIFEIVKFLAEHVKTRAMQIQIEEGKKLEGKKN